VVDADVAIRTAVERGRRCHGHNCRWRRDASACPSVLHHAANRRPGQCRSGARRSDKDRQRTARAEAGSLDHLLQRPCGAVLSFRGTALYHPCWRVRGRAFRRPRLSLGHS
jgi:hypothetical protein